MKWIRATMRREMKLTMIKMEKKRRRKRMKMMRMKTLVIM
jgi:hypothetical protein